MRRRFTCSARRPEIKPAARATSIFFDYDPRSKFNAFDLVAAKRLLEKGLGVDVDLTTRSGLHPLLRKQIESEATRVF